MIATLFVRSQAATVVPAQPSPSRGIPPVEDLGTRASEKSEIFEETVSVTLPPQAGPDGVAGPRSRAIPEASVARLAVYLRMLGELADRGAETVSSDELAAATGVNPAKLRKDLSYIGSYGIRGVGYEVSPLLHQLERTLGLTHRQAVALVGVGNLGHALAGYGGFGGRGFPIVALFDVDPDLVGISINGIVVDHVRDIPQVCAERGVTIGIIATPGQAAQGVCDVLLRCGVQCILNFAPVVLQVPEEVEVRKVDLAVELQILAFHVARRHLGGRNAAAAGNSANGHPVIGSAVLS
jgi:redox-sensing transcriptional repressor